MITVASINVNGIRASVRQRSDTNLGFNHWLRNSSADIVCLQEVRANPEQTQAALAPSLAAGWHLYQGESENKGRSGVAILSRIPASEVRISFPSKYEHAEEFAASGRYIEADYGNITISSVYIPAGQEETPKQAEKERFTQLLLSYLHDTGRSDSHIVCGDWNIAHTENDIKNARGNMKKSGFLPSERQWFDQMLAGEWVDVIRYLHPQCAGPYTWWSPRGQAFDNNVGWRIDYHIATKYIAASAIQGWVDKAEAYNLRWSDHAPVVIRYDRDF